MSVLADTYVRVRADTTGFGRELTHGVTRQVGTAGRQASTEFARGMSKDVDKHGRRLGVGFSRSIGGGFRGHIGGALRGGFGLAAAGLLGGAGLVAGFKSFISEARESNKITALTNQVIRSTGGVAGLTTREIERLSMAVSNKTGIDDEAIQRGANLLLTFKNLRNEAGKGNDVFSQTTSLVADMSVALGTDAKSAALQLGKALNDPATGLTALRRSGVAFTKETQEQIKTLFASGHQLEAQKLILKEVGQEFGGAAAAASTPMDKLKVTLNNVKESIGKALIPWIDKGATALRKIITGFTDGDTKAKGLEGAAARLGEKVKTFGRFLRDDVVPALKGMAHFVARNSAVFKPLIAVLGGALLGIKAVMLATRAWAAIQLILNTVMSANPIGLVVVAIAALAAGVIYAYKHSETFRKIVQAAWHGIQAAAQFAWNKVLKPIFGFLADVVKAAWKNFQTLRSVIGKVWDGIKNVVQAGVRVVAGLFLGLVGAIVHGAARAFGWVPGLGGKLKAAAAHFDTFRDHVNRSLSGIDDEKINILASYRTVAATGKSLGTSGQTRTMATGGGVFGAGTGTSDSIPALLSNGEHVWTAREVQKAGGHGAVERMRQSVLRLARGGAAFDIRTDLPSARAIGASVQGQVNATARRVADMAQKIADKAAARGIFSQGGVGALDFARRQVGKPYIWGGVGPAGYDCSGFMSAITNVIKGNSPYSRLFATGSFGGSSGPAGFVRDLASAFRVGVFHGNPGHMAGTLNGVNVESRGGEGVVVGPRARGWNDGLFDMHYGLRGFAKGGRVGDPAFDLLHPNGKHFRPALLDALQTGKVHVRDRGGPLQPGLTYNGTGGQEQVVGPNFVRELVRALEGVQVVMDGKAVGRINGRRADLLTRGG